MKSGFIYLWRDSSNGMFYLGAHLGTLDDGYTGSSVRFKRSYKQRPDKFKRRILEFHENTTWDELVERERYWLNMIKHEELNKRYYNLKKVPTGGDIVSHLSPEAREQWGKKISKANYKRWANASPEVRKEFSDRFKEINKTIDRSYLPFRNKMRRKFAVINGYLVLDIKQFSRDNKVDYGNLKATLGGKRKHAGGFTGYYL